MNTRRLLAGSGALLLAAALVTVGLIARSRASETEASTGVAVSGASATTEPGPSAAAPAPASPPARICDNQSVLAGPARPPAGAVVVLPSQNLITLTEDRPAGTTFWLVPGVHTLGTGQYDQVTPKAGNTYIGAPGAIIDGQHLNLYAFSGPAGGVIIRNLTIQNFGRHGSNNDEGVVNHETTASWTLLGNTIRNNAGNAVMVGTRNLLRHNCLANNGQSGFGTYNATATVSNITLDSNEITGNNTDDWERLRPGCGCTAGGKFWEVTGAIVRNNWVHNNNGAGLWADTNNAGFLFEGNYIDGNDSEGLIYEISYNAVIRSNTFVGNGHVKGPTNGSFPTGAIYISESGSDPRVPAGSGTTLEITDNVFKDNWSGVVLWENSDRFSGSPAEGSQADTLVNPELVTAKTCTQANIKKRPYFDDCRWKTQNVQVHHNLFSLDPSQLPATCSSQTGCGYNGLFANYGTSPAWSPYKGTVTQEAVALQQNNKFSLNVYSGPWSFVVPAQGSRANWTTWQGAPYSQDTDSVIKLPTPSSSPTGGR
ncbi:right-handed parallel beta-helix repeat-containing protein [Kribbella soli]|uniref:Right-handed parallel beta-helix repeat-containing protein n=1 Tax=Kribbella soli TaxID=1124743 RepID=A0A4R0H793_9ACTN|nr:right-handed parallel beta-helix repeat-containing protein [Kribbella soli]TCC05628.1 right-handed parallel beta-helix repeat-containing protein [Kribbella soli]